MSADEIKTWLIDGIAAAKAGERPQARELLLRVVGADENNLQAWLWLSGVVTTLEDREVCLENVLALEPDNEPAQRGLQWVREQIEATPEIEPESALPHVEAERTFADRVKFDFSDDELNNPLLCVYCANLTRETDRHCPHCKRSLYRTFLKNDRPRWIWVAWAVSIAEVFVVIGALFILLAILASALSVASYGGRPVEVGQLLMLYLGQTSAVPPQAQIAVLTVLPREQFYLRIGYAIFTLIVACGLLTRKRIFHILYIGGLAVAAALLYLSSTLNRTFVAAGAAATPLEGIVQVTLNEALGVFITIAGVLLGLLLLLKILLAFLMEGDFETVTGRLWCAIDPSVREANTAFIRAKTYMQREMWTLAALYLQRAVSLQPSAMEYYLALAECYAHLGRYQRSLHLLDQAQQLQPGSPVILNMRGVILDLQSQSVPTSVPELPDLPGGL